MLNKFLSAILSVAKEGRRIFMCIIHHATCDGGTKGGWLTQPDSGPSIRDYEPILRKSDEGNQSQYRDLQLYSAFQPIFSPSHGRVVGYEGLLRAKDTRGRNVCPSDLFGRTEDLNETLYLDRLCRLLHVRNFSGASESVQNSLLFLNLTPEVIRHSRQMNYATFFTQEVVKHHGLRPEQVVIEILESAILDEKLLLDVIEDYRKAGFRIAVDDFGAGESNLDRLWKLAPDIIKLDRSLIFNAGRNPRARRLLPGLVNLIHQIGGQVLLEGIETEEEAMIALDADVDMVQGFIFARPEPQFPEPQIQRSLFKTLARKGHEEEDEASRRQLSWLSEQAGLFWQVLKGLKGDEIPTDTLQHSLALRWYVLDENGIQLGRNYQRYSGPDRRVSPRFNPLQDAMGADWSRRPYYRRAMRYPGEIQVTGPYFSIPDASFCVTFSLATHNPEGKTRIYCCDFAWQDEEEGHAFIISGSMGPWGLLQPPRD